MNLTLVTNLLIDGIWVGLIYAVIAATLGIIFRTSTIFHFAHGTVYAFIGYIVSASAHIAGSGTLRMVIALAIGVVAGAALGWTIDQTVYRYLQWRQAGTFTLMVASLGVSFIIAGGLPMIFGVSQRALDFRVPVDPIVEGDVVVLPVQVWGAPCLVALLLVLWRWYERGAFGRRARAVGSDPELTEARGISSQRTIGIAFAVASGALALPALLVGTTSGITTAMGDTPVLFGFTAVIFGGLRSYWGWVGGALVVGIVQGVSAYWVPTGWTITVAFGVVLVMMLWRPQGIGGRSMRYL